MALAMCSPAKVNLHLAVGDVRADGFHELVTVFQAITLADTITLAPSDSLELVTDVDLGIPAEENLAVRAARAFAELVGEAPLVRITIEKRIPAGAGLGGGSSNAATVIAGLAHMWGMDSDDARLHHAAASLGADVPFFLDGGTGLYEGRGDVLIETLPTPRLELVFLWPREPVSTAKAYIAMDHDLARAAAPDVVSLVAAIRSDVAADVAATLHNDMTPYSAGMVAAISDALALLDGAPGVMGATMAGSGSAVCGVCESSEVALDIADQARDAGWWAEVARSTSEGAHVLRDGGETA